MGLNERRKIKELQETILPVRVKAIEDFLRLGKLPNVKDKRAMRISFKGGVLEMHCDYTRGADGMGS